MTTVTLTSRTYEGERDLQPVADLLNLVDAVDKLDDNYSVADLQNEFSAPEVDPAKDLRLWDDADGQLVAFGQVYLPKITPDMTDLDGFLYFRVHPDHRTVALEDEIVVWGENRMRELSREHNLPAALRSALREGYDYQRMILERHGMRPVRYFFRMERPLDAPIAEPVFPEGITTRRVESAEDEERWVEAFNLSFIDHYNFHPMTLETYRHYLESPSYSPERNLIAVAPNGEVAAFAFCWLDTEANERNGRNDGWVNLLGVRRGYRKIGLGKAMLLLALQRFKAEGLSFARLGVDAENPSGALQLYESVGFERFLTAVSYQKQL